MTGAAGPWDGRPSRRRVLSLLAVSAGTGLAKSGAGAVAGSAAAAARARRPHLRVLSYGGMWPPALRDWLARIHGMELDVDIVASPEEARTRVRRATRAGPPGGAGGRASPVDLVSLGLEEVAAWREEGLLAPLTGLEAGGGALAPAMQARGALESDGRIWLSPMTLGFDGLFALGARARAALQAAAGGPDAVPSWSALLAQGLEDSLAMEPEAAVRMALRRVDPQGVRLAQARTDAAAAKALCKDVTTDLKPFRAQTRVVWTDAATFVAAWRAALGEGRGLAGVVWDGLIRRLVRAGRTPEPAVFVPADGAPAWVDGLAVPVGAAQPAAAVGLLQALAEPEAMAVWAAAADAIPVAAAAWPGLPAAEQAWLRAVFGSDPDAGLGRLWVVPALSGPLAGRCAQSRDRFEYR